ncbi:MAG: glycosyltransferase family 1 protein [Patescibacteria group bacterium]
MRIGIDARMYSSSFTGIGRYVFELVRGVTARHDMRGKNTYVIFLNEPAYTLFQSPHSNVEKVLVNAPIYSLREQTAFCKALYEAKLDLMHFTHFNAPIFYRRPSIVTIHDLTVSFFPGKKFTGLLHRVGYFLTLRSIVNRAKKIIAVSRHTKKDLQKLFKIPDKKIAVITEAAAKEFRPLKNPHCELRDERPFILYTGNWRDHKNLVGLIRAFGVVKKSIGAPLHASIKLVITGRENPYYPEVKQAVQTEKLEHDVEFTGLVSDEALVHLYNAARVYVLPSFYEGFGLPILEAFACDTPVACSKTSSLPEVGGDAALYFNPHDVDDMAAVISQLLTDEKLREQCIARGREQLKKFSWEKMAKETLEIYSNA